MDIVVPEDAEAPAFDRGGIVARCGLSRGRTLSPGIQRTPYYWRDVVHGPPPRRRLRGDCSQVSFHGTDDSGDVRLAFGTIIRVDPGADPEATDDDIIHVEERLYVQRRLLQEWIDRERAFSDRMALRMRARLAHSMVSQRRAANRLQYAWTAAVFIALIRFQAKAGTASIRAWRGFMRSIIAIPDFVLTHTERVSIRLASRTGRRTLKQAVRDPASATPQEKSALLVVMAFGIVAAVLLLNTAFAITFLARWGHGYQVFLRDFVASVLGTIALPIPAEIFFVASIVAVGFVFGGLGLFVGKMVGAWMLYLLGDSLFDTLNKKSGPKMRATIGWVQRNANRYGFATLLALNAIPLAPDALIIVFAVSGMRFRSFMLSIAFGTIIKFTILALLIAFVGPEAVQTFMEHPIQTMRGA